MSLCLTQAKNIWPFDPKAIGGLACWYDASDSTTVTLSGSNVTQWRDKSDNAYHLTVPGGLTGPTQTTYNSLNVMNFSSQGLINATTNIIFGYSHCIFLVYFSPATSPTRAISMDNGTTFVNLVYTNVSYRGYTNSFANVTPLSNTSGVFTDGFVPSTWQMTSISVTPDVGNRSQMLFKNGASQRNGNHAMAFTGTVPALNIGYSTINNERFSGQIAEIIMYRSGLVDADRSAVETYLARKWNLQTALPTLHLYKTVNPFSRPFIPTDIDSCRLWLDGADRSADSMTLSGNTITTWRDKSGQNNTVPNAGTLNPSGTLGNGLSTVQNGSASTITTNVIGIGGTAPTTLTAIGNVTGPSQWNVIHLVTAGGANAFTNSVSIGINPTFTNTFIFQAGIAFNGPTVPASQTKMVSAVWTGTRYWHYDHSGYVGDAANTNPQTDGTIRLWTGDGTTSEIGEVIIYAKALMEAERQRLEAYLAWKWGTVNLLSPTSVYRYMMPSVPTGRFSPTLTSGTLRLWLDATDPLNNGGSSFPTLGTYSIWFDKSGNSKNAIQGTVARRPTFSMDNGVPAFRFIAANSQFFTGANGILTSGSYNIYVAARASGNTGSRQTLYIHDKGSGTYYLQMYARANNQGGGAVQYSSTIKTHSIWSTSTAAAIHSINDNSALNNTSIFYGNGTLLTPMTYTAGSNNITTDTGTGFSLGYNFGATDYLDGFIYEVIVTIGGVASTTERQLIEGYLAWKWNIQDGLPSTHPYKKRSP